MLTIKDRIEDLKKALKDAEYNAAHLITDIVSNYKEELDPKKEREIEDFKDTAINTLKLLRSFKNIGRERGWVKGLTEPLENLYEEAKNENYTSEK